MAAIIDGGGTNGIMFSSIHIWPFSYPGGPTSFCNILKDTRGFSFYLAQRYTKRRPEIDSQNVAVEVSATAVSDNYEIIIIL
jgi:hypothetical protein